jgi:GNAT superfamily N-acetyltransferase
VKTVEVVRTYLALDDRSQLRAAPFRDASARVERRHPCPVHTYRRLYKDVGQDWYWHDRLEWSDHQLAAHLAKPNVGVWELMVNDESAGYYELARHDDGAVEIAYFGLTPKFIGQGLGGPLLAAAVREAWAMGAKRVWLHTCTLDSERALPNYLARGFQPYGTQRLQVEIEGKQIIAERVLTEAPSQP